jgi:hypothetical protein
MAEFINKQDAIKLLESNRVVVTGMRFGKTIITDYANRIRGELVNTIRKMPTADVEYVRHGYWITVGKTDRGAPILQCSWCGRVRKGVNKTIYCRDCGAKMDLQEDICL